MKQHTDKWRFDREFQVGDLVYVKLQPYRQKSVVNKKCLKVFAKYFGPYKILSRIGLVAYKLELHSGKKVHLVFHVSQLKKHLSNAPAQIHLPLLDSAGIIAKEPLTILDKRMNKCRGQLCTEIIIQ